MRDRQPGQPLIAGIVIIPVSPLKKVRNGRPADIFMSLIHLDEQRYVGAR